MSFKQDIEKLIASNLKTYRDNADRFIADYNRELELTKEYNGRQLLELLQNADDAGSNEVWINWDKENAKLSISNQGEPFETGGIKSLMLANLSTKTKISYIGNKGLGFRSILNWSEQVVIYSNGCQISFSEKIAADVFNKQLNLSAEAKQQIRSERNLAEQTVPFPVLAIPKISEASNADKWTTTIAISYRKEFEADIEHQLAELREEILLFLNNIQKITIQKGAELTELASNKVPGERFEQVSIKDKQWKVFSRENILPPEYQDKSKSEQQSYNLKVAFQDDLSDNYRKLFNFFPTQLSISLPCIIHGTFELNSSRNHLNESKKNEFILKELVQLLKECANYLTEQQVDWRAYKLISPASKVSDSKLIETFYAELEKLKQTEKIYPCINNAYNAIDNTIYYNDEFNCFFQEYFPEELPELCIPLNNELPNPFSQDFYEHSYLVEKMDNLSNTEIGINLRAELIAQLAKVISFNDEQERFSLLVNESGKVISKDDLAFTPVVRSEERFNIPNSVKVDFMKSELYDLLVSKFEQGFDKKEPKSRELQRCIKSVVNLQPYDSNNVIDKIITGTKDALKSIDAIEDKINCIKEMVAALYANFKNIDNRQEKLKISVPLASKARKISDAELLYLSETYPSGNLTEIIYYGFLKPSDYLAVIDFWGFNNEESALVESFFLWLGVNQYSRIEIKTITNRWEENDFFNYIFENGTDYPDDFDRGTLAKGTYLSKIKDMDLICRLPVKHIILLALKDETIRQKLEANNEKIDWFFTRWRPTIIPTHSYIRYQFIKANLFTKYILEDGGEELNKLINNNFQIDYDFLGQFGINKTEVKSILIKLGAKESFNDLAPETVYQVLQAIPEKDKNQTGKATQTIYKMALESLVKQESTYPVPDDIHFFSKTGNKEAYLPANQIYYSDNSVLPKKIISTIPIINLPKRVGEDNVEKHFGVKSLKEFKIEINRDSLEFNACDTDLSKLFENLKPYLLAYRLESPNLKKRITDQETKRKEAKTLKQCNIRIVNKGHFSFGDNHEIIIENKEFINEKDTFYFKESFIQSVDGLRRDSLFCDAFAEMMCIIFKVNDLKNDFRQILKNDIQDTIHLACQDLSKEIIEESFALLGVSRIEIDFWANVFSLKGKQLQEPIENLDSLKQKVFSGLGIHIPESYSNVDFDNFENRASFELIKLLCEALSLRVNDITPQGLYFYHKNELVSCIKNHEFKFERLLWISLKGNPEQQKSFIRILNKFKTKLISQLENTINSYKYNLTVDYEPKVVKEIFNLFNVDLNLSINDNSEILNQYETLLGQYKIEEVDISDEEIRSLLYFDGNAEAIEQYLKAEFGEEEQRENDTNNDSSKLVGSLIDAKLSKNSKIIQASTANGNSTWVHSSNGERGKKRKGKKAELIVYNTLVDKYGIENVKWVSGNSTTPDKNDKLHYDIEYKNENGEWKYLEVKAISDNQFIISGAETNKGISEPNKFEVALANDNEIYIVKDLFIFDSGETFESNSKFVAYPKDYVFVFDVNTIKED